MTNMAFKFVHSSDLHLGRRFANIPEAPDDNIRGRLMEARHASIQRLAQVAAERGAEHILLAGDTFDTSTPSASVIQQSLSAMSENANVHWWILPGNHDNLKDAEPLWDKIGHEALPNVHALMSTAPVELCSNVQLLPCPVEYRTSGSDPTADLAAVSTSDGELRIGLAHAGVVDFANRGANISPDRDRKAGLDYLALGDWHGRLQVTERTHYSGSPEQDRFKHGRRGSCLVVSLDSQGAPPHIEEVETGEFLWIENELPLLPDTDVIAALQDILPAAGRRDMLMRVKATGWASLRAQSELSGVAAQHGPNFAHFELNKEQLKTSYNEADIDEIDKAGALRRAADRLKDDAETETLSSEERSISAGALARLYSYVKEAEK